MPSSYMRDIAKLSEKARKLKEKDEVIRSLQCEQLSLLDTVEELKAEIMVKEMK